MIVNLKQKLDYHYKAFNRTKIEPDPLQFLHLFKSEDDIEVIGFIASVFAYGSVRQIINTLNRFLDLCACKPFKFIQNFRAGTEINISHRFYTQKDVSVLFFTLAEIYKEYGSLKEFFYSFYDSESDNLKNSISGFSNQMLNRVVDQGEELTNGLKFMFPIPEKGSACKRMNLFLRWMVRKDELDFGLWNKIPASKLIIPVDTNILRISKELELTSRKIPDWKMAEEITNNLKKFDPEDPVKYDFALCHIGMRKLKF